MSESVNMKVVIFWIIFIFVFVGLALFGFFNQDLLEKKVVDEPYIPVVNSNKTRTCIGNLERGNVSYDFILNEDNTIKSLRVVYTATAGTIDDYAAATSLSKLNVLGINATLQNEYTNFTLVLMLTINSYDATALAENQQFLDELNIVIANETSLDNYNNLLNAKYGTVTCTDKN